MTRTDRRPPRFGPATGLLALCLLCLAAGGCVGGGGDVEPFPEPGGAGEASEIVRESPAGCIVVTYASYPLRRTAPPDGIRLAMARALGNIPCSAASFYWSDRDVAMRWIREQAEERRRAGAQPRLILAGHGLGATEAAETAREILFHDRDIQIVLILTVDAVKANRLGSAAGVTGNAIVNRLPGVNHSFTAYDAAPVPDGQRVLAHINYYQDRSGYYHGTAMPGAENHLLTDWTGLLNHGNSDEFALPQLTMDLRRALERGAR